MGYVKQGFKDGDVLNASQLVKIEQGIQDNEKETAKKAEHVVFEGAPERKIAEGVFSLLFVQVEALMTAISEGKEVSLQINGNGVFGNGFTYVLPFAGSTPEGLYGFSYSGTTVDTCMIISAAIGKTSKLLVVKEPIVSIDDGTEVKY